MAAAAALLVIMPVLASDGLKEATNDGDTLTLEVLARGDAATPAIAGGTKAVDARDTRVGNTLYASNSATSYSKVLISYATNDDAASKTAPASISIDIENETTGVDLVKDGGNFMLRTATTGDGTQGQSLYQGIFYITTGASASADYVIADHDEVVSVTKGAIEVTIKIDDTGPTITGLSPTDDTIQTSDSATFSAVIKDDDSGLRDDSADVDGDAVKDEPLAVSGGSSADITVNIDASPPTNPATASLDDDQTSLATSGWSEVTDGFSFVFTRPNLTGSTPPNGTVYWNVVALDRTGNSTTSDVDADDDDADNGKITIDGNSPDLASVKAGLGWDADDEEEEDNAKALRLEFDNGSGGGAEDIDADTVAAGDFILDDAYTIKEVHVDDDIVYLHLAEDLAADATPDVQMLAGVIKDVAGNSNGTENVEATDNIDPTFTVTVTGETTSGRPNSSDEITVKVTSDEDLDAAPVLYVFDFLFGSASVAVDSVDTVTMKAVSGETNSWSATFDEDDVTGLAAPDLAGILVTQKDENNNRGTTGEVTTTASNGAPEVDDVVDIFDLSDDGLLFELDDTIDSSPTATLLPNTGTITESESTSPFIEIDFAEGKEFTVTDSAGSGGVDKITIGDDSLDVDSHALITITSITLKSGDDDAVDVSASLARVDDDTFNLATSGLAVGSHELKFTAEDSVGNELEDEEVDFEILERSEYEVDLRPGWNLVSVPGTPTDSAIGSVLPSDHPATTVLSYQGGEWKTAVRDGTAWSGTLTTIETGFGYWISTAAFTPLETMIPEADPASVLPTVPVVSGWNLLGVVDIAQNDAGDAPAGGSEADDYLSSISWDVAYEFSTATSAWTKTTPDNTTGGAGEILNGKGYWVWASKAGTLVP